jgi:hypothetical protein
MTHTNTVHPLLKWRLENKDTRLPLNEWLIKNWDYCLAYDKEYGVNEFTSFNEITKLHNQQER